MANTNGWQGRATFSILTIKARIFFSWVSSQCIGLNYKHFLLLYNKRATTLDLMMRMISAYHSHLPSVQCLHKGLGIAAIFDKLLTIHHTVHLCYIFRHYMSEKHGLLQYGELWIIVWATLNGQPINFCCFRLAEGCSAGRAHIIRTLFGTAIAIFVPFEDAPNNQTNTQQQHLHILCRSVKR